MKRDPCVELWCSRLSYSTYNNRYCQTRRTAALEGTKCGVNKVGRVSNHCLLFHSRVFLRLPITWFNHENTLYPLPILDFLFHVKQRIKKTSVQAGYTTICSIGYAQFYKNPCFYVRDVLILLHWRPMA